MTKLVFATAIMLVLMHSGCSRNEETAGAPGVPAVSPSTELANRDTAVKPAAPQLAIPPRFVDIAQSRGIDFTYFNDEVPDRFYIPEIQGGGVAWVDFDSDGWLDLYLINGCRLVESDPNQSEFENRLFRNLGNGHFVDVTRSAASADTRFGHGVAVGDFDADGFYDLYISNYGENALLRNNGDGTFEHVENRAGVADPLWGTSTLWVDANADGLLDLYVANYTDWDPAQHELCLYDKSFGYCGPRDYNAQPDRFFLNQGDGTFVDAAQTLGLSAPKGKALGVVALDLDNDVKPEIYVANDMCANFLFTQSRPSIAKLVESDNDQLFLNLASVAGCAVSERGLEEASMGIACGDFDRNGFNDIYLTHFHQQKGTLYQNQGNGLQFLDASRRTKIARHTYDTLGFGTIAFDYDRDGALDLFMTNGHVLGSQHEISWMRPQLLQNEGAGNFVDVSSACGPYFERRLLGRAAAGGDFDNDGDLDLAISHLKDPFGLLENRTETGRSFLGLELATANRIPPIGGRVIVHHAGKKQMLPVMAGGSYLSSSDQRLLFGLDNNASDVTVEIHWPSGRVDKLVDLEPNCYWLVREGQPAVRATTTK